MTRPRRILAPILAAIAAALVACGRTPPEPPAPPATRPATEGAQPAAEAVSGPASTASPVGDPASSAPSSFACAGGDPPWTLRVSSRGGTLRLGDADSAFDGPMKATATGAYTWLGVPRTGAGADPLATIALLVLPGTCFPGDGAAALAFSAELSLADGRQVGGCCATGD